MASLMDRSFEDRRIGSDGLALDSSLTTVTLLFWSRIPLSGARPVDARGKVDEKVAEKTKAAVMKGDFCRLASGMEGSGEEGTRADFIYVTLAYGLWQSRVEVSVSKGRSDID